MSTKAKQFPILYIGAWIMIGFGVVCLGGTLLLQPPSAIFKGLVFISFALILFGTGELLNHPRERLIEPGQSDKSPKFHRRRNVCSLGNLSDICALLLFFMGLAALLYQR